MSPVAKQPSKSFSRKQRGPLEGRLQSRARGQQANLVQHGVAACPDCGAVYFDKHWHSCSEPSCRLKAAKMPKVRCEECRLVAKAAGGRPADYAGELIITGVTDPSEYKEIKSLALHAAQRAETRDPEDRIVALIEEAGRLVVRTSENQLAVAIGKQIHEARKGGDLTITWSKEDKPVRVRWTAGKRS